MSEANTNKGNDERWTHLSSPEPPPWGGHQVIASEGPAEEEAPPPGHGFTHKAERRVQWRAGGLARPLRRPRLPQGPPHAVPSTTGSALSYPHSLLLTCFSIAGPPSWENVRPRGIQECASSGLPCPSSWWAPRGTREPSDTLRRRPPDAHRALQRDGAEAAWAEAVRL